MGSTSTRASSTSVTGTVRPSKLKSQSFQRWFARRSRSRARTGTGPARSGGSGTVQRTASAPPGGTLRLATARSTRCSSCRSTGRPRASTRVRRQTRASGSR
ncbi:MAG: hypothetical protein ACK559_20890 [bacterium]